MTTFTRFHCAATRACGVCVNRKRNRSSLAAARTIERVVFGRRERTRVENVSFSFHLNARVRLSHTHTAISHHHHHHYYFLARAGTRVFLCFVRVRVSVCVFPSCAGVLLLYILLIWFVVETRSELARIWILRDNIVNIHVRLCSKARH